MFKAPVRAITKSDPRGCHRVSVNKFPESIDCVFGASFDVTLSSRRDWPFHLWHLGVLTALDFKLLIIVNPFPLQRFLHPLVIVITGLFRPFVIVGIPPSHLDFVKQTSQIQEFALTATNEIYGTGRSDSPV